MKKSSFMLQEALETPEVVQRQLENNHYVLHALARKLAQMGEQYYSLLSVARGSSDHAAQYLNYLTSLCTGKLTTSLSLSLITLQKIKLDASRSLAVAISQSGESPDVFEPIQYFKQRALATIALVNKADSPLARTSQWVVPLHAGEEKSVAATKSFIASLAASVALVNAMDPSNKLQKGLRQLPEDLKRAQTIHWEKAVSSLATTKQIMVVGRGLGLPLALEAALKFKETCSIQAEAFSSAEIKHGPWALVEKGYHLMIFANRGPAQNDLLKLARDLRTQGAQVLLVAPANVPDKDLLFPEASVPELDVICAIQTFYLMVEELSRARGLNPDRPRHLSKVTRTT